MRHAILAALLLATPAAAAPPTYTSVNIGTLAGGYASGLDINASGWIAGGSGTGGPLHAFLYNGTTITDLNANIPGFTVSVANGINDAGWTAGHMYNPGTGQQRAFIHYGIGVGFAILGSLGGLVTSATAINAGGTTTGYSYPTGSTAPHAFRNTGGTMTNLGTLGGASSVGLDINDAGWVVGTSLNGAGLVRPFLHNGATMIDLGTLGGSEGTAYGVNANGWVVGTSFLPGNMVTHPFLYDGISMIDLGTLGGNSGYAEDINASAQIVGRAATPGGPYHAFLHDDGVMFDLNTLIATTDPLYGMGALIDARAINDAGQIVALGINHTYLLTPIPPPQPPTTASPEPATLALLGAGLLGLAAVRRRARH